eukprot:Amastigsp_a841353_258.p4 type:complete len:100 gc:universal Amastigsp_a841353_258:851-552(-)
MAGAVGFQASAARRAVQFLGRGLACRRSVRCAGLVVASSVAQAGAQAESLLHVDERGELADAASDGAGCCERGRDGTACHRGCGSAGHGAASRGHSAQR